ncbi:DUF1120 domain-containing protein [Pseudomonas donghuensis]|nr:DUF1120 domain-containing protein [Pseudomonas donghuensis]
MLNFIAANAMAATTDLTVTGVITPTACTPTLGNGGVVDYGTLSLANLEQDTSFYHLPAKTLDLTIDCSAPINFALIASDNRHDSSGPSNFQFGLGTHAQQNLGFYFMSWKQENVLVDGNAGHALTSHDGGNSWSSSILGSFNDAGKTPEYRSALSSNPGMPSPATNVSVTMDITGMINNDLSITENAQIDGSATIEVLYL